MKNLILTCLLSMFMFTMAEAQTKKPKGIFLHHVKVMNDLNMTEEQRAKILEIKNLTDPQIKSLREDKTITPKEMNDKLRVVYTNRKKMQYEVLNAEQIKKLEQLIEEDKKSVE